MLWNSFAMMVYDFVHAEEIQSLQDTETKYKTPSSLRRGLRQYYHLLFMLRENRENITWARFGSCMDYVDVILVNGLHGTRI